MSEHASLAAALAAFQAEAPTFPKTKTARVKSQRTGQEYTYKYADLGDILPVVGPLMASHGLSWSSGPSFDESGEPTLVYTLRHTSGESESNQMWLGVPKGCKPQELGSAITYARRYALTAQLNLATEEDDDGQTAQHSERDRPASSQPVAQPANGTERAASAKQRGLLNAKASEAGLSAADFANVILIAAGQPAREFESDEHADQFVKRQLDRLPARLVDPVLAEIAGVTESA